MEIKIDPELNSFVVSGPATAVERFKEFISFIDKPVPVILIEVMIIEVSNSSSVSTSASTSTSTAMGNVSMIPVISVKADLPKGYGRKGAAPHALGKHEDAIAA